VMLSGSILWTFWLLSILKVSDDCLYNFVNSTKFYIDKQLLSLALPKKPSKVGVSSSSRHLKREASSFPYVRSRIYLEFRMILGVQ
jgi:hypothetical protein